MEICRRLFHSYLDLITVVYFNDHDLPPDDITEYKELVEAIKGWAVHFDELELLLLAIDYHLSHPEISLEDHGGRYPFMDEEVREILRYVRSIIWPNNPPTDEETLNQIVFVNEPYYAWQEKRRKQLT